MLSVQARANEQEAEIMKGFQERERQAPKSRGISPHFSSLNTPLFLSPLPPLSPHRELQSTSSHAQAQLAEANGKVRMLQSALETTQSELLEVKNKYDEEAHAK